METNVNELRTGVIHSRRIGWILASAALLVLLLLQGGTARAAFQFEQAGINLTGPDGRFSRQAGAHPDLSVNFAVPVDPNAYVEGRTGPAPAEPVHEVDVDLPLGFVGNPEAISECSVARFVNVGMGFADCPLGSQVGVAEVHVISNLIPITLKVAVYNLEHSPDVPARFGFNFTGAIAFIDAHVGSRAESYGISSGSAAIAQTLPIDSVKVTLWGVPADPSHDTFRPGPGGIDGNPIPSQAPPAAFLSAPTSCTEAPVPFTMRGDSWDFLGIFDTRVLAGDESGTPFVFDGCEQLPFAPSVDVQPRSHVADSPTGLDVDLQVPQNDDPDGLAAAHVKEVAMTFPKGMSINSASASGQGACSSAQIDLESNAPPSCPDASKLGTVRIDTPLLPDELEGDVFLASQNDNPFHSLLALYIAVKGPGFYLKLPGRIDSDPETGQLTTTFSDNPQLPFERLQLSLNEGPRAPLSTPRACGTYTTHTELTSWAQPDSPVALDSSFTINQGCATGGFNPKLNAGTINPAAGAFSPFTLQVTRQDGEQNIAALKATLPSGLLAKLAGVPLCGDAQAASGNCPASSQVGTVVVGSGSGPLPLYVPEPGKAPTAAYLAGPYKGGPYSLVVKVPAQAGPFDLGTVTVRNALRIDPTSTQVSAESDPLPQILQGIPIAYRDVRVEMNRPEFTLNPTSCKQQAVRSVLTSSAGQTASPSSPFAAANCERLAFKPALRLKLRGGAKRGAHPALTTVLQAGKGQANLDRVQVALPHSEFLAQSHIKTICTRVQFGAGAGNGTQCPAGSVYGKVTATSPLLDYALSGDVYLRSSSNPLPDMVLALKGPAEHPLAINAVGRIDSKGGGIRTTFEGLPDAPLTKVTLQLPGGAKSLLENSTNICRGTHRATLRMDGQNGKSSDFRPALKVRCGKGKKRGANHGR